LQISFKGLGNYNKWLSNGKRSFVGSFYPRPSFALDKRYIKITSVG